MASAAAEREVSPGVAHIKPEFIVQHKKPPGPLAPPSETTPTPADAETASPPAKKRKLRGQNKHRPPMKINYSDQLCPMFHGNNDGYICQYGDKCRYSHDVKGFLVSKPQDIGDRCYLYGTYGYCPSGVVCRYGSCHITDTGESLVNSAMYDAGAKKMAASVSNVISKSLQVELRKKKVEFSRTDKYLRTATVNSEDVSDDKPVAIVTETSLNTEPPTVAMVTPPEVKTDSDSFAPVEEETVPPTSVASLQEESGQAAVINVPLSTTCISVNQATVGASTATTSTAVMTTGPLTDEDTVRLKPLEKKKIDFRGKLYLAPLTTVGNLPFRRICKQFGADITCGEMSLATNLLQGQQSEWALLKRHESEDLFGVQVCGSFEETMLRAAELIDTKCNVDFIDINVGCPIDLIFKRGAGCGLMQRKGRFERIVRGMSQVIDCPLTVKMRTGVYDKNWNAHKLAPMVREWGASLLTIHGRSREQRYTHLANWEYISKCAELADPLPVFGNGDIFSFEDYHKSLEGNSLAGVMIARGALIKPWLFTEIKERRHWDISSSERLSVLQDYVHFGLEHWGSDTQGVERTRRFMLEWLSFLHRYVPVGVLERLPQRINERPPLYQGRDELETMMASRNCRDWIKISEMLLGPVPENFNFLPKHKANSYSN